MNLGIRITQLYCFILRLAVCNKHLIPRNIYIAVFSKITSATFTHFFIVHLFILWMNYDWVFFSTVMTMVHFLFDCGEFENGAIFPSPPAANVCLFT